MQTNNRLTNAEIGERVHLSETAVRRRLAKLRRDGTIIADVAVVAPTHHPVTVIIEVVFREESADSYRAFREQMLAAAEVSQCYSVSGSVDFIVVAHAQTLEAYEQWGHEQLLDNPAIARYSTHVVWSTIKQTYSVPLLGNGNTGTS